MKYLIGLILGFVIGFYVNSLLMYTPPLALIELQGATKKNVSQIEGATMRRYHRTAFNGKTFTPDAITIQAGQKIEFVNESPTTLMQLVSSEPSLQSPRGYGEKELHSTVLMEPGEYLVTVNDIPTARMSIIVTPL